MKNRLLACTLLICALISCLTVAQASTLRYSAPTAMLSFNGTTATCSVTISEPGKAISATMQLWQGTTLIDSWSKSASSVLYLSKTHSVVRGKTYTVRVNCTVDGSNYVVTPVSKTCPR